jgi:hypothetical protein
VLIFFLVDDYCMSFHTLSYGSCAAIDRAQHEAVPITPIYSYLLQTVRPTRPSESHLPRPRRLCAAPIRIT